MAPWDKGKGWMFLLSQSKAFLLSQENLTKESDKGISKHQAAWVEALFGFAFDIPPGTSWDQVTSTLSNHLDELKAELLVSIIKE